MSYHGVSTPKKLFAVEVYHTVYVFAESEEKAEALVVDNASSAWQQSKEYSQRSVSQVKNLDEVEDGRAFDRPLGSDKKLVKELV